MERIKNYLSTLKMARKQVVGNLTVFQLLASGEGEVDYVTLDEALESKVLEISEIDLDGHVPELKVINSIRKAILIIEGEELVGAKQNRMINASFLIPGQAELVIPVSCVEKGRWAYKGRYFASGKKMMPASLKKEHQKNVAMALGLGLGYRSDQSKIWGDIDRKMRRFKSKSDTAAMSDLFDEQDGKLSEMMKSIRLVAGQVGAVLSINGKIIGLETYGDSKTASRFFEKLIKSYAIDALDFAQEAEFKDATPAKALRFLQALIRAKSEVHPSIGLGQTVCFESRLVSGAGLVNGDKVLHLSAYLN